VSEPGFVLDSSFLIKLHRDQPIDLYPSLWDRVSELLATGDAVILREADREMQAKDDDVRGWPRDRKAAVVETSVEELEIVRGIAERHPAWVRGAKNSADPFVFAAARTRGALVVTDERPSGRGTEDRNLRIPTVAAELDVECILPTELIRRCGWRF
jgi:Domain of unknown function (DUF4411)